MNLYQQMTNPATCRGFIWIGGPIAFAHCQRCGEPFWEHTHSEERHGQGAKRIWRRLISRDEGAEVRAVFDKLKLRFAA